MNQIGHRVGVSPAATLIFGLNPILAQFLTKLEKLPIVELAKLGNTTVGHNYMMT
jgi:hypothetical protein